MNESLKQEAIDLYGKDIVNEVIELVNVSDPDGVWAMCQDMGMDDHVEVVEMLYFEI